MRSWRSLATLAVLALVWGSSFLWIKLALAGLSPVQIALSRLTLGALVILGLVVTTRARLPRDRKTWLHLLVPAFFGNALPFCLFGLGERTVDSGVAGVLNSTMPLWALLISVLIGPDRRPGLARVLGLVLGFLGTLLIFAPWRSGGLASWGALACLVAAACYAISYTYIGRKLSGTISPVPLSAAQLSLGALFTALALPVAGLAPVRLPAGVVLPVLFLGVVGTGLTFVLNNRLIAEEGATTAASVGYLMPVVSVLLGAAWLGEPLTPRILVGMVVVLGGVALSRRKPAEPRTRVLRAPADRRFALTWVQTRRRSVAQRDSS